MQFNSEGRNCRTNYEAAIRKLMKVGLPRIRVVWWWVTARGGDFPSKLDDDGVIMIGGFDGSVISLLMDEEVSPVTSNGNVQANPMAAMQRA